MLSCKLDTIETAKRLVGICDKYDEDIDVIHRRQVIDGKSLVGVISLVGNIVSLDIITNDSDVKDNFEKDIMSLQE